MTLHQRNRLLYVLPFSVTLLACTVIQDGMVGKRIVVNRNHKYIYKIQVPEGDTGVSKIYGGHGHSFRVGYRDSAFIYYSNDTYVATPNDFDNYKLIGFATPIGGLQADTVIGGKQADGRYWKEVFHNGYYVGYKNVSKEKVELFDNSLATFRRTKQGSR